MSKKPNTPNGGKRPGAGRKPSPQTALARLALSELEEEAEKSIAFLVKVRNDEKTPVGVRVECARDLIDRRFGKPKQMVGLDNDFAPMVIQIVPAAGAAAKPDADKEPDAPSADAQSSGD